MNDEVLVKVDNVSKKFCRKKARSLKPEAKLNSGA